MKVKFKYEDEEGKEVIISKERCVIDEEDHLTLGEIRELFYDFCATLGYQVQATPAESEKGNDFV